MIIFSTKGRITPVNDKTNLLHKFDVPENISSLKITYSYSPKTLENREKAAAAVRACFEKYNEAMQGRPADYLPVKNLVTISIDCNGRYIGAAHRQDSRQVHIIGKSGSSPGFINSEIEAGEWDIMLNAHCVCCDIDYTVTVEGEENNELLTM